MGNTNNKNMYKPNVLPSSNESIRFDKIAAQFILSQSSSDISKLTNIDYCNNLIILITKIIKNEYDINMYFTTICFVYTILFSLEKRL